MSSVPARKPIDPRHSLIHVTPWGQRLEWRLPILMATSGFRFATQLHKAMVEEGVDLSYTHIQRLTQNAPERLTVDVQFVLCRILNCSSDDLWADLGQAPLEPSRNSDARDKLKSMTPVKARISA
jgi:Cro/C1-type HTH DNA-binding domain